MQHGRCMVVWVLLLIGSRRWKGVIVTRVTWHVGDLHVGTSWRVSWKGTAVQPDYYYEEWRFACLLHDMWHSEAMSISAGNLAGLDLRGRRREVG